MNLVGDAIAWILDPVQWTGPTALSVLLRQQLLYTVVSVVIAALIAVPLGWAVGHTGRGREVAVAAVGAARAIPAFGLLVLLVLLLGVLRKPEAAIITFVILAIPSLLAGAYSGFEAINRSTVDAARASGMTEWQVLRKVEIPLGAPLLVGGFRSATLQVVSTVTIAAYIGLGGLGLPILTGLNLQRYDMVLGGSIMVALLAVVLDAAFALAQQFMTPIGLQAERSPLRRLNAVSRRNSTTRPEAELRFH